MSFLEQLDAALRNLATQDERPVVVSAAMWPVLKAMGRKDPAAVDEVLDLLIGLFARRGLLMPSFTHGFNAEGMCDLDTEPGSTGVLSEALRRRPGVVRTLSAWFSYLALGPCADEVLGLQPEEAWGEGSVYAWMELRDVCFLMLGTHPTHCSYLHRLEWLAQVPYRFNKPFNGVLVRHGRQHVVQETLYVRCINPIEAVNDFTLLMPQLREAGMREIRFEGISLAAYEAGTLRNAVLPVLRADSLYVLKNRNSFAVE